MTPRFLSALANFLFAINNTRRSDDDAATAHEALHGDSALIRLVCELRELEAELADDTAAPCR